MHRLPLKTTAILFFAFFTLTAHASSYQRFAGLSYSNPAALSQIKKKQVIIEGTYGVLRSKFNGSSKGGTGTAFGEGITIAPYMRYAHRINEKLVFGFDLTEPFISAGSWPSDSIVRYDQTGIFINSVDLSPNISYNFLKNLAIGGGIDVLYMTFNTKPMVQTAQGDEPFNNHSSSPGLGWHMGLFSTVTSSISVGVWYFSPVKVDFKGPSTLGNLKTRWSTAVNNPAVVIANVSTKITPKWTLNGMVSYSDWDIGTLHFHNTARGDLNLALNFVKTWRFGMGSVYKINNKWSAKTAFFYDQGLTNNVNRNISIPTVGSFPTAVGIRYQITPALAFDLDYIHIFFHNAPINNTASQTFGIYSSYSNTIDARLTWDL